ncbi:MAG: tryptophan synthase subunit alpha [Elusimicrobiota bacterium]
MISYAEKLDKNIRDLMKQDRPGLSLFLTGGYPDMESFIRLVKFIDRKGLADFVEVGIPFSDPVADGPVIQESSRIAIEKGASFKTITAALAREKQNLNMPLVLMSYLNPLYSGGFEKNMRSAVDAGFASVIIPDLPVDESEEYLRLMNGLGIGAVFLSSPATSSGRIKKISASCFPFMYYVSRFGTTGMRSKMAGNIKTRIKEVKRASKVPVYCGFGISTTSQAALVGTEADGIIIGSAIVKMISGSERNYFKEIEKFAISIKKGLAACRRKSGQKKSVKGGV